MNTTPKQRIVKQRIVDERLELLVRLNKLRAFIGTEPYGALPDKQRILLVDQEVIMTEYARILDERLSLMESAS